MGLHVNQPPLFAYRVHLEHRVRPDHPLRAIHAQIDFTFIRAAVAETYGHNGNESVDPVVILKLLFLLFYDNIASERELLQMLPERLDYLWFLGYELDEAIPHHSVLSKARRRWGRAVFEQFFVRTVGQCVAAGLVAGDKVHLDSSLVDAHAANRAVVSWPAEWVAQLKRTFAEQEPKLAELELPPLTQLPGTVAVPPVARAAESVPTNATLVSRTDPSAAIVRGGGRGARARFKTHRAVDDAHGVITATETTAGDVDEATRLLALVVAHEQHTQQAPTTARRCDERDAGAPGHGSCSKNSKRTEWRLGRELSLGLWLVGRNIWLELNRMSHGQKNNHLGNTPWNLEIRLVTVWHGWSPIIVSD